MEREEWRVGELARATGLTIRTLHHYDEVGLLKPSGGDEAMKRAEQEGPAKASRGMVDPELMAYAQQAIAARDA